MPYQTVALIGKPQHEATHDSLNLLAEYFLAKGCKLLVEESIANELETDDLKSCDLVVIGKEADLAVVVGGDGSMLGAARVLARFDIHVVGVNRGNLGFLTDIHPDDIIQQLDHIFNGECFVEERFLLEVGVYRHEKLKSNSAAVNEVVLHHGKVAHMMEFEIYIDEQFVFSQRSDGLIVATPTGSTAYSLSAGGPIIMPKLDALTLVPMFPHTLSSRPIVVDADSQVSMKVSKVNSDSLQVSCDSHIVLPVLPGDEIRINKSADKLHLVHPKGYSYFNVLRQKLGWGSKLY
ncbi:MULTISPECIES: NAD(+) kinase [Alteromonas]|jgi:NAD+ kinase|uniref:NAD kinase n=1 Tax=Alteromonas hispanica TaxID=315421 RepID=A0A6L9MY88_9ALTE|nr:MULTISPECIES: NAD(+) kinase [Alteromonas]APE05645.1 NAD(+) kinase [Alteromonas sp. RW2A1]AUC87921.1 NAD(+) kinase [Alteromonas sp. MB-3u-76]MAI65487.1 NAD(+) kinase [Alteromonas sp.]NDW23136.1 NAD(+) kinase [Alteromonas hispanica]